MFIKRFGFVLKMYTSFHFDKFFSDIFIGHAEFGYVKAYGGTKFPHAQSSVGTQNNDQANIKACRKLFGCYKFFIFFSPSRRDGTGMRIFICGGILLFRLAYR